MRSMKHVVLCAFRPDLEAKEVRAIIDDFATLADTVASVQALEHGANVSPEGLSDGFTHCFTVTFAGAAERDEYLVDPVHLAFVERFTPTLQKILVVDYETSPPQLS
jgi:hypothetical protein